MKIHHLFSASKKNYKQPKIVKITPILLGILMLLAISPLAFAQEATTTATTTDQTDIASSTATSTSTTTPSATATTTNSSSVISIPSFSDITVVNGTPFGSIGLPTSTIATLGNSDTINLPILWDRGTPTYSPSTPGTYAMSGNLFLLGNVTNPNNIKSNLNVIVAAATTTATTTATSASTTTPSTATTTNQTASSTNQTASSTPSTNSGQTATTTTATTTASTTPSTATTTATSTSSTRGSGEGSIGGRRQDVSSILAPQFRNQGQVLGASTSVGSDIRQQLLSIIQQLINIFRRYSTNLSANSSESSGSTNSLPTNPSSGSNQMATSTQPTRTPNY